jgi:FkbM family methyltransferase
VDVGGYTGNWTRTIVDKYNPRCFIFEPVREHHEVIVKRFSGNSNVTAVNCGLARENKEVQFFIQAEGSTTFQQAGKKTTKMLFRDIAEVFDGLEISEVDLITINIEGEEFELFDRVFESGLIEHWKNLQVQFHAFVPGAREKRHLIQEKLSRTHTKMFDYPFVWEGWQRKRSPQEQAAVR